MKFQLLNDWQNFVYLAVLLKRSLRFSQNMIFENTKKVNDTKFPLIQYLLLP